MKATVIALTLTALSVIWGPTASAHAGDKVAKGWITISGKSGGGATFEQTFKVDPKTKVFAKGAGTAVAAKGGRAPFADLVKSGDRVTVSYRSTGKELLATDVHVRMQPSH